MNILMIGCGRTAKEIAKNLQSLEIVDKIILYSRTGKSAKQLAKSISSQKINTVEEIKGLQKIDFAIIAVSGMSDSARQESFWRDSTTYQVRQDELKFNIGAITQLIKDLKHFSDRTKIIVVTNPVDEITNYLNIMLKDKTILGFGLELDAERYSKALGSEVKCIGTHGKAIPLINSNSEKDYDSLLQEIDSKLLKFIRINGIPYKAAGKKFRVFFEKLNSQKEQTIYVSAVLKKPLFGVEKICISLPFKVKKGNIIGVEKMRANAIEKQRFASSAKELEMSVKRIIETHKKLVGYK